MSLFGKYMRFMPIAQALAEMSKSPTTKVGAVILGTGSYEIRASGWNGAPRGSDADVDGRSDDRASRLIWACHAEANAIANAARHGAALAGCTMVVTHTPCMACAKLIVQAGICAVVTNKPSGDFGERWRVEFDRARQLFAEVGVTLVEGCDEV